MQDTLKKIQADRKQLAWEVKQAKHHGDMPWLRNLRTWHKQLLGRVERAIAKCNREMNNADL